MTYGCAIFGDNQFLGVNHANQAIATQLYDKFNNTDEIIKVIGYAYEAGVRDFMFTTNDRYELVFDEIRRSNLFPGLYYTPCIPYAHKYWNRLSSQSLPQVIGSLAVQLKISRTFSAGLAMIAGRRGGLISLLIALESLMCKGLPVRGVFLQNAAFDLLIAIEAYRELEAFADVVESKFKALPGFITMNHPKAVSILCDKIGLDRPWVCANYNQSGFRTNPSKEAVESSFALHRTHNIAMSVFASGQGRAQDSFHHVISTVGERGGIDSILFGSSNSKHIQDNVKAIFEAYN